MSGLGNPNLARNVQRSGVGPYGVKQPSNDLEPDEIEFDPPVTDVSQIMQIIADTAASGALSAEEKERTKGNRRKVKMARWEVHNTSGKVTADKLRYQALQACRHAVETVVSVELNGLWRVSDYHVGMQTRIETLRSSDAKGMDEIAAFREGRKPRVSTTRTPVRVITLVLEIVDLNNAPAVRYVRGLPVMDPNAVGVEQFKGLFGDLEQVRRDIVGAQEEVKSSKFDEREAALDAKQAALDEMMERMAAMEARLEEKLQDAVAPKPRRGGRSKRRVAAEQVPVEPAKE